MIYSYTLHGCDVTLMLKLHRGTCKDSHLLNVDKTNTTIFRRFAVVGNMAITWEHQTELLQCYSESTLGDILRG